MDLDSDFGVFEATILALPFVERILHWGFRPWVKGYGAAALSNLSGLAVVHAFTMLLVPTVTTEAFLALLIVPAICQLGWFKFIVMILIEHDDGKRVSLRYGVGKSMGWLSAYLAVGLLLTYHLRKGPGVSLGRLFTVTILPGLLLAAAAIVLFTVVAARDIGARRVAISKRRRIERSVFTDHDLAQN